MHRGNQLQFCHLKYDFVGIRFLDFCEKKLPNIGYLDVEDIESGECYTINTRDKENNINTILQSRLIEQERLCNSYKVDLLDLAVGHPFINELVSFFHKRIRRQV